MQISGWSRKRGPLQGGRAASSVLPPARGVETLGALPCASYWLLLSAELAGCGAGCATGCREATPRSDTNHREQTDVSAAPRAPAAPRTGICEVGWGLREGQHKLDVQAWPTGRCASDLGSSLCPHWRLQVGSDQPKRSHRGGLRRH